MNIGIIGAGSIASKFCDAARLLHDAKIIAVASKEQSRADEFAKAQEIPESYGNYKEMLEQSDVELIYIATTHNFHYENIKLCLEHGKHVICEKCMVLTSSQAREVFHLAEKKKRFLMEAMWSRFLPIAEKVKAALINGTIGEIQFAHFAIGFLGSKDSENRILNPALAGGAMYDIGVYAIEMAECFIGEITEDHTITSSAYTGVDNVSAILIRAGGIPVTLQCCISSGFPNYAAVYGNKGYIELPNFHMGDKFYIKDQSGEVISEVDCSYENGFQYQIRHAIDCIAQGKLQSDIVPPSLTIKCSEIFDHALHTNCSCIATDRTE